MAEILGVVASDPYAIPEDLQAAVAAHELSDHIRQLVDDGYTIIQDPLAHALTDDIRAAILRLADQDPQAKAQTHSNLLDLDPVFAAAICVPKLLVLVDFLLGKGAVFSQLNGSIRRAGRGSLGVHADSSWFPAPFPAWEIMCTACWVTDEFTLESGATLMIPGTHKLRRHPPPDAGKDMPEARSIVASKGSLVLWNGSVWHGNYPRQLPGERVVLHMTYTRLGMQPIENYDHLDTDWFADKPAALRTLLGREHFLGRTRDRKANPEDDLLSKTYESVFRRKPERLRNIGRIKPRPS